MQSLQIQASDAFYDDYYVTVPGTDTIEVDGKTLTGGTRIRSRTEYNEKTRGMMPWGPGVAEARQSAQAEMASRPVRNVARNLERMKGECLPMRRLLANPRRDRRSAV